MKETKHELKMLLQEKKIDQDHYDQLMIGAEWILEYDKTIWKLNSQIK